MPNPTPSAFLLVTGLGPPPSRIDLGHGMQAVAGWPGPPIQLKDSSRALLGTIECDLIDRPQLVISTPIAGTLPADAEDPESSAWLLHWAYVSLALATRLSPPSEVTAKTIFPTGELETFEAWTAREARTPRNLIRVDWFLWPRLFAGLTSVARQEPTELVFMSALRSFWRACQQNWVDDRLDLFARSVETLIQMQKHDGALGFAKAVLSLFCRYGSDRRLKRLADQYQRRSDVVHGNRFLEPRRDSAAIMHMELLARRLFRRVLTDKELLGALMAHQRLRMAERTTGKKASRSQKVRAN